MTKRLVLAGGLLAVAVVLALTLLQSAPRRSGTDLTPDLAFVTGLDPGGKVCQDQEILPADTAALRMTLGSYSKPGPALSVAVSDQGGRPLTSGYLPAGWQQGSVRLPVAHVARSTGNATVCLRNLGPGGVAFGGNAPEPGYQIVVNGRPVFGRLRIEYLRPGSESWLTLLPTIVHRFALGKSDLVRHWAAPAALVLALLAIALAVRALLLDGEGSVGEGEGDGESSRPSRLRGVLGRVPTLAWLCALAALANGLVWSLILPPFEVPDENAHYAYVAQVAERGSLPHLSAHEALLSPAQDAMLSVSGFFRIVGEPRNPAPFDLLQQQAIEKVADEGLSARGSGNALSATNNPPLYYLFETIPFKLVPGGKVLDRLAAMRLLSALMGAGTVLLIFLFLRELLPRRPFAWSCGALMVAFQPLFGLMSGGVNNDNLLYLCAAGVLWAVARAFRRGLTPATGVAIGVFLGLGLITKLTLLSFIPAVVLALVLLRRASSAERPSALRGAALAAGLAAAPAVLYLLLNRLLWHRGAIPGGVGKVATTVGHPYNFREELSHVWQLFLPHLWMHPQFPPLPVWDSWWFKGFIGRFGWLDYTFTWWVYRLALVLLLVVGVLAIGELVRHRRSLRARLDELSVYVLVVVGLWAEIGVQSYRYLIANYGARFEQARYLLPLLGLYAAVMALGARFAGRRFGPVLAAALVVIAIGHNLFAQIFTIARYYT